MWPKCSWTVVQTPIRAVIGEKLDGDTTRSRDRLPAAQQALDHVLQVELVEVMVDRVDVGLQLRLAQAAGCKQIE